MKKNQTKVACPKCGTEFAIPETTTLAVGIVIGSDSNLGTIHPEVAKPKQSKADAKIEALRKAGVDVSNIFAIRGTQGEDEVGRLVDGQFTVIPSDDPIFTAIRKSGTVPNRRLFRRWVMAQVFHMLTVKDYGSKHPMGFTKALNAKGYKYSWNMVVEELRVQSKLYNNDMENYLERNRWFDKDVVVEMAEDYINELQFVIEKLPHKRCKSVPYIHLQTKNIFLDDINKKVIVPLMMVMAKINKASTPLTLYRAAAAFSKLVRETYCYHNFPQSKAFKDAYKGAGAFFTMKNLIMFHDCTFPRMDCEKSLNYLNYLALHNKECIEGWKLFGIMKEFLADNKINIAAKQAEWRN